MVWSLSIFIVLSILQTGLSESKRQSKQIQNWEPTAGRNSQQEEGSSYERESTEVKAYEDDTGENDDSALFATDLDAEEAAALRSYLPHSDCEIKYETVSVVKQVPSFTKHCQRVDDTKCKTIFKNAFTTKIETRCTATFDTNCDTTLETAFKQECKIIKDVECRIVNLEGSHGHESKKICEDVPTEKCVPVPVKVEGQKCVNVPTQVCENVPVTASVPVPKKQCYKKPRKVCQTIVSTKPKVVTAQIPREVCGHSSRVKHRQPTSSVSNSKNPLIIPRQTGTKEKLMEYYGAEQPNIQSQQLNDEVEGGDYSEYTDGQSHGGYSADYAEKDKFVNTEGFDQKLLSFLDRSRK